MATPRAAEHRDIEQRFRNLEQQVSDLTSTILRRQPIQVGAAQYDAVITPPANNTWTEYTGTDVAVPDGYTRALVNMTVAHGVTWSAAGAGNTLGVQAVCNGLQGPAIATATPDAVPFSVLSSGSFVLNNVAGHIDLDVFVIRNGSVTAGSENVHISASVIFLR